MRSSVPFLRKRFENFSSSIFRQAGITRKEAEKVFGGEKLD